MFLYTKNIINIIKMFENFDMLNDGSRVVLFLAIFSLWIACFAINKKALDALKSNNKGEMKTQVEQLRNATWALYVVYLLTFFLNMTKPFMGLISGSTSVSVIGIVLSTVLVLCITHVSNTCMDDTCDMKTAQSNLERMNILLGILVAVHLGTLVIHFMGARYLKYGFTAEIMELLRTPSAPRQMRRGSSPSYTPSYSPSRQMSFGGRPPLFGEL